MPHVVYALCGDGRGHTSRALAVASALRERGHRVTFAAGEPGAGRLRAQGETVLDVPSLRQIVRGNRVRLGATAWANLPMTWRSPEIIRAAAGALAAVQADLVVADHEPFVGRAAARLGLPVVALSHQLVLTETVPEVPWRHRLTAWTTAAGTRVLVPPRPDALVVPSFFFPPLRRGSRAALVPPILRDDVLAAQPRGGDRVLVYLNEGEGMGRFLDALGGVDVPFDVYGLPLHARAPANVTLCSPSRSGFLADLAASRAVVATAGFTLLSEALHLGKPVLALPNRGFFEQTLNALYLARAGRGEAVLGRPATAGDVSAFLDRADRDAHAPRSDAEGRRGRDEAVACIGAALGGGSRRPGSGSALRWETTESAVA